MLVNYITLNESFPVGSLSVPPTQRRILIQRWSFGFYGGLFACVPYTSRENADARNSPE